MLHCSFGMIPTPLVVIPEGPPVLADGLPSGTILDFVEFLNIEPFGECMSPMNPEVIILTAAALGVFTPAPCIPIIVDPWLPGADNVLLDGMPALSEESMCMCAWGGVIEIIEPGEFSLLVE